ncbi:MAG: hypothetical protein KTR20_12525 [Cellvibrionaceae bacterium]|nr:hypothetical protein [Cellvibrionaceae bacterium]
MTKLKHPTDFNVKLTVKKVLEVSHSGEKGIKLSSVLKKGPVTFKLDNNGNIDSSAKLGRHSIKGFDSVQDLGVDIKFIKIKANLNKSGDIEYIAEITYGFFSFSVKGYFDVEKIVDRGLLKKAYQPLKNRQQQIDNALKNAGVK